MASSDSIAEQKSLITAALDLNDKKIKEMIGADKQYDSSLERARKVGQNPDIERLHSTYGDITKHITTWHLPALTSIDMVQARRDEDACIDVINKSRDEIARIDPQISQINFKVKIMSYINAGTKSNEEIYQEYSEGTIKNIFGKSLDEIRSMNEAEQEGLIDRKGLTELQSKKEALAANAGYANQLGQKLANLIKINDAYQAKLMLNVVAKAIPTGKGAVLTETAGIFNQSTKDLPAQDVFGNQFKEFKALNAYDVIQRAYAINNPDINCNFAVQEFMRRCGNDRMFKIQNFSVFSACQAAEIENSINLRLKAISEEISKPVPDVAKIKEQVATIETRYHAMIDLLPGKFPDREKRLVALKSEIQNLKDAADHLDYASNLSSKQKEMQDLTIKLDGLKIRANDLESKLDKKGFSLSETIGSINPFAETKAVKVEKNQVLIKRLEVELINSNKQLNQYRDNLNEILNKINAQPNESNAKQQSKALQENLQRINDLQGRINETNRQIAKANLSLINSLEGQEKGMAMVKALADYARNGNQAGIDVFLKDKKAMPVVIKMLTDVKLSVQVNQNDLKALLHNEAIKGSLNQGLHNRWTSAPGKPTIQRTFTDPTLPSSNRTEGVIERARSQSQTNPNQQNPNDTAPPMLDRRNTSRF